MASNRDNHAWIDLEMTPIIIYPSCHRKLGNEQFIGINGSKVDDLLRDGSEEWKVQAKVTLKRLEMTGIEQPPYKFTSMHIHEVEDIVHIDPDFYMNKMEKIPNDTKFIKFASMQPKLAWLANIC